MESELDRDLNTLIANLESEVIANAPTERRMLRKAKDALQRCLGSATVPEIASIALGEVKALLQWLDDYKKLRASSANVASPLATPRAAVDCHDGVLDKWASELYEGARGVASILDVDVENEQWEVVSRLQSETGQGLGPDGSEQNTPIIVWADDCEHSDGEAMHDMGKFDPMYYEWYL
ncbi:hypothetical protein CDEST_15444 [Colletotrichum destructivum]|uniref:Uncharacterized protein n=1 Tax=Colletotrichum destructivum TaxID=34406 RepID=A0AAX4J4J4_9PEZI|nr:hypothetical protein CDEST_15444 [Colletotrichum destructivum]